MRISAGMSPRADTRNQFCALDAASIRNQNGIHTHPIPYTTGGAANLPNFLNEHDIMHSNIFYVYQIEIKNPFMIQTTYNYHL